MFPLRDENPIGQTPYMNIAIMAANVLVFFYQLSLSRQDEFIFFYHLGVVPAWLTGLADQGPPSQWFPRFLTLISYQFVHGGFFHLAGNMLYLWIFGNNVEAALGRLRYLGFYLLGGVLASLSQILSEPGSGMPMVGASGAIAAVLGAYLMLFPRNRVLMLIWLFFYVRIVKVPALVVLAIWFLFQVLGAGGPGVAWMAHIGGFVAGLLLVRYFLPRPKAAS